MILMSLKLETVMAGCFNFDRKYMDEPLLFWYIFTALFTKYPICPFLRMSRRLPVSPDPDSAVCEKSSNRPFRA